MTEVQLKALLNPVSTSEALQEVWNESRAYMFAKDRTALVAVLVSEQDKTYSWTASIRVQNMKRNKLKKVAMLVSSERLRVRMILQNELNGVGLEIGSTEYDTEYTVNLTKKLTEDEYNVMLSPHLLGH